jgi:hypothetical protein
MISEVSTGIGTQNTAYTTDNQTKLTTTVNAAPTAVDDSSTDEEQAGSTIVTLSDGAEPEVVTYSFGGIKKGPP